MEMISLRAQGWILASFVWEASFFFFFFSRISKWAGKIHVSLHRSAETGDTRAHTHSFCRFSPPALSPGEHDWLLRGGGRGLATGAGQKNSRLFTFSLQQLCFTPPPPPHTHTSLSSCTLNICLSFQLPSDDVGQRQNYPGKDRKSVIRVSVLMLSKNVEGRIVDEQLWQEEICMQFTTAKHSNMKPGTQTHADSQACTQTTNTQHVWSFSWFLWKDRLCCGNPLTTSVMCSQKRNFVLTSQLKTTGFGGKTTQLVNKIDIN